MYSPTPRSRLLTPGLAVRMPFSPIAESSRWTRICFPDTIAEMDVSMLGSVLGWLKWATQMTLNPVLMRFVGSETVTPVSLVPNVMGPGGTAAYDGMGVWLAAGWPN